MVEFRVSLDARELKRALKQLGDRAPKALSRALNRTAQSARTQAVRAIAADLGGIRQKRVRENLLVDQARPNNLVATLRAVPGDAGVKAAQGKRERQGRIPLLEFHARASRSGVRYRLPTGKGYLPHAFFATMKSGHKGVWVRLPGTQARQAPSSARLGRPVRRQKIIELFGPSIPRVFARRRIREALLERGRVQLSKNLMSQVDFVLQRRGASRGH